MGKNLLEEIIERVKDAISREYPGVKILDKNAAHALGIEPANLSVMKCRNKIPYDELTMFCIRKNISANWLLFGIGEQEMRHAS